MKVKEIKVYDVTPELRDAINKLHTWLSTQTDSDGVIYETLKFLHEVKIKGYYTEKERDLLNTLRIQYYIEKEN